MQAFVSRPYHGIFHPTIEIHKEGAFLSQSPLELMYSLEIEPMPSICGFTEGEGLLAFTGKVEEDRNNETHNLIMIRQI